VSLDKRILELIAVGASVAANCQPCLEYNVGKASEFGADSEQIAEAIEVGKRVRQGAALKMDKFALNLNSFSGTGGGCECNP
jgi:AhpD family alkylhydroperoxidase